MESGTPPMQPIEVTLVTPPSPPVQNPDLTSGRRLQGLIEDFRKAESLRRQESENIENKFNSYLNQAVKEYDQETKVIRDFVNRARDSVRSNNLKIQQILNIQPLMIEEHTNRELPGEPDKNFRAARNRFEKLTRDLDDLLEVYSEFLEEKKKKEKTMGVIGGVVVLVIAIILFNNRNLILDNFSRAGQQFKLPDVALSGSWPFLLIGLGGVIIVGAGVIFFLRSRRVNPKGVSQLPSIGRTSYCMYCGKPMQTENKTCNHCGQLNS